MFSYVLKSNATKIATHYELLHTNSELSSGTVSTSITLKLTSYTSIYHLKACMSCYASTVGVVSYLDIINKRCTGKAGKYGCTV